VRGAIVQSPWEGTVTAQVHDLVTHGDTTYSLVGVDGEGLFDPADHGVEVVSASTACWRGFACTYAVVGGGLRLVALEAQVPEELLEDAARRLPDVFGVAPTPSRVCGPLYDRLDRAVVFTGGLLLGDGFLRDLYRHMGFHPAWKYERVVELLFTDGGLTGAHDRSAEMAAFRDRISAGEVQEPDGRPGGVDWVRRTFTRDYGRSLPPS
jgi:hypothetical protein